MTLLRHIEERQLKKSRPRTQPDVTMTIPRRPTASDIASACGLDDRSISFASETTSGTRHIGLHMLHADAKQGRGG